ncbi:ORF094 [Staphylococcus phage X2]|uniref:ORF094 n=1 Tax=Staphylococcus phage X2 TaxID=2908152 RepID=Q4ZA98_9CAUD|nr:ORF094 [Staphylococcus phage X2]AAX92070.1 ORF094 [Staphylococcus phage X2]
MLLILVVNTQYMSIMVLVYMQQVLEVVEQKIYRGHTKMRTVSGTLLKGNMLNLFGNRQ